MRVPFEGSKKISLFGETLFGGENQDYWLGGLKRLFFMLCLYSWDDIWGREMQSFSAAFNCGIINFIYFISFNWLGSGSPLSQDVLKVTRSLAVGTHDCKCKMFLLWAGLPESFGVEPVVGRARLALFIEEKGNHFP